MSSVKVNREQFLSSLDMVYPGISPKEIIEQGSCFVFKDGMVITFNDEIACRHTCDIGGFEGAVQADPLLKILRKLEEEEVTLDVTDGELIIKGKKRRAGIRIEQDIVLPVSAIEAPGKWTKLNPQFTQAVSRVIPVASKDQTEFLITCIHITPECVEASNGSQIGRWTMDTKFKSEILIRRDSARHIESLGVTKFSITKDWIHFLNKGGLIFSCRKYIGDYKDLTQFLKGKGAPVTLPKGLAAAAEKAEVFSSENDDNEIIVELRPGKVKISGVGVSGWFDELKKIDYDGPPMKFMINPQLLAKITTEHNTCELSEERIKVKEGSFVYATSLVRDDKKEESQEEEED